jgi:hypothetical protein
MKTLVMSAALVLGIGWIAIRSSEPSPAAGVADAPPVVIKTFPEAGKDDVNPTIKEIRVTFSKKMADGSWSWSTDTSLGEPLPGTDKPRYLEDGRTCVLPVKLEPGKTYATWLNSANFGNFRDAGGKSAVPYLLVFQTKR